ncbi:hypothetical protein M426DRAFT_24133 [Hypoxylon sp. CI-4A]|nr:hypothetical protein M426DRAFT_24133 [Hypoxylon sp. CI-4A]
MAFSFGNIGNSAAGASQAPPPNPIQTEALGFLSLSGDAKLRLTSPWSSPPPNNASLISIASRQGFVAAAGPDGVILAPTEAVRKAFDSPKDGDSDVRPFDAPLKLPLPMRICQLAFTADEAYLILSAEQGGGLAVYETQALQQGATEPAFQLPTNGEQLRALVPNPRPEKGELCAVVTSEGKLLMANMKERSFTSGPNGQILRDQVSCVAWSNKGKQLVAGLGDGTMVQMTPDGAVKAEISRPSELSSNYFVSSLIWLENDIFLAFYVYASEDMQEKSYLITRQGKEVQFQNMADPIEPFGTNKVPHQTILRLKDFPPNLQDCLICSSTSSPDIGLFTRSKTPLVPGGPSNVFVTTELGDDSKRATLPMGDGMESPPAIGTAFDLSSHDKVYKPIPTDELDQSPGPLPGYWVLNADGVLSVWWVVYSESIREGTTYPGLAAVEGNVASSAETNTPKPAPSNPFAASAAAPFGAPSAATGAFGSPSAVGSKGSPWGTQSTSGATGATFGSSSFGTAAASSAPKFSAPSFGTPSLPGAAAAPAFGQSGGGLGARASPWASGAASSTTPTFGQASFGSTSNDTGKPGGVFGSSSLSPASSGGFAGFASKGGFASLGSNNNSGGSSIFASTTSEAPEVSMDTDNTSMFRPPSSKPNTDTGNVFGSQPFKLTSSFQRDPNATDDDTDKVANTEKSMFGSSFAATIDEPATPTSSNPFGSGSQSAFGQLGPSSTNVESTTPTSTPAPSKFMSPASPAPQGKGLFNFNPTTPSGLNSLFESSVSQTPTETPHTKQEAETPKPMKGIPDAPLPPESTSKAEFLLGDSSSSSATTVDASDIRTTLPKAEDAPLPPEFVDTTPKPKENEAQPKESPVDAGDAPLPPDPVSNKKAYDAPLPPLPGVVHKPKPVVDDTPLPPDPIMNKAAYSAPLPPLPGTAPKPKGATDTPLPPDPIKQPKAYEAKLPALPIAKVASEVAGPGFKFPTDTPPVPSDSEDDDLSEVEGSEAATEGSGVDVAKDLSPASSGVNKTPGFTPQSSFDGLAGSYSTISRPDQDRRSFFGELGRNAQILPQPYPVSPRSPSPVRGSVPTRMLGKDQPRSFSAPGMASQILGATKRPQSRLGPSIIGKEPYIRDVTVEQQRKAKARQEAEQTQLLLDEEDDAIQSILKTGIQPTLELDEFIGHTPVPPGDSSSVPSQVEAVYRDINAMIDTLGLNARSLAGFIRGHKELYTKEYTRQDLADPDDWTLSGLDNLAQIIEQDLGNALEEARVKDVPGRLREIEEYQHDLSRDRNKQADLRKIIASRLDPEQSIANRSLPLSAEQVAQQSDLRREYAKFSKLLAEAEENLTLLKAKVVSANSTNGKGGPTPTIEAVVRTITKLTGMIEKRSSDVDLLENQMRKLRLGSHGPASREGSPFATPNAKRLSASVFSPDRSARDNTPTRGSILRHSIAGSIGGGMFGTPPRRKLSGFGDVEKKAVKEKRERRAAVLGKLQNSLHKKGANVWALDGIE